MIKRLLASALFVGTAFAQSYSANEDPRLASYLERALKAHPVVHESLANYRAAQQRIPQASALPEPELGLVQYVRSPETRVGSQTTMLSISQRLPWFGKLSEQAAVASKQAAVHREIHETEKAELVRQVKQAYYGLAYLDRAMALTREERALLGHFETLAQARYSQGVGLQHEAVKLQAEITRDDERLQTLAQQRIDAEASLNTLLNRPPDTPIEPVELRLLPAKTKDVQDLYAVGREQRPELKAALLEIESDEKRIDVARKQYWPDITLGAGFVNVTGRSDPAGRLMPPPDNGKDIYNFRVDVRLPIRRRKYDAAVIEATEGFLAAKQRYRRTQNQIEASIRSLAFRLESLREQISLFKNVLLPQAEQALRSGEAAYASGLLGVIDLLDSERTLLEVRLGLARLESDYMKALGDLERAIGSAFPEVTP